MRWLNPLRSGAFRFALLFAAIFALGSALLLIAVEHQVTQYAAEATIDSLTAEVGILRNAYLASGRVGLISAISVHMHAGRERTFHYLVADRAGQRLAGDLPDAVLRTGSGQIEFVEARAPDDGRGELKLLQSLGERLGDGSFLVVATDTYEVQELRQQLDQFALWCGIGVTILALVSGYVTASLLLRRLESVNATVERIMATNLTERLPSIGISREFDQLSANLNRMLDRIGAAMAALRQVSTDVAHDLRTPLTRLRQGLEASRGSDLPAIEAAIEAAVVQTDEILAIFRALLRIGTLEGGATRSRFAAIDLSEILERLVLAYQPVAEDEAKQLDADIRAGVVVQGDSELLTQLFANLIENALAHTLPGTLIVVALDLVDRQPVATVKDNGPGIPASEKAKVFDRFYRLDASRNLPGAGLGLSLVAAIAALHGADIELLDHLPGLRVTLSFPR